MTLSQKKTISAGGVVISPTGLVLIVSQHGTSWSLPKGHIEAGEDTLTAAKREVTEESGISDLQLVKKIGSYVRHRIGKDGSVDPVGEEKELHFFLFKTNQTDLQPIDPENPEARWVKPTEVTRYLTHPKDKEFFNNFLTQLTEFISAS